MQIISRKEAKEQGLDFYYTGKPCKHGHVSKRYVSTGVCLECIKNYNKEYREENRESIKEYNKEHKKEYYQENKERVKKYNKEYHKENKERIKERMKEWRKENRERIAEYQKENKERIAEYYRERYANDPDFKVNNICRRHLRRVIKATNTQKESNTFNILGYSPLDLRFHIESFMLEGMSWDNYGSTWHIDHMTSIAQMIKDGIDDPAIINALDNLRPMWAEHNMNKKDKDFETWILENPDFHDVYSDWLEVEGV